jgi:hypothetical protein
MKRFKGTNGEPKRTQRPMNAKTGWPTGRESYGHGTPIVGTVEQSTGTKGQSSKEDESFPFDKGKQGRYQ